MKELIGSVAFIWYICYVSIFVFGVSLRIIILYNAQILLFVNASRSVKTKPDSHEFKVYSNNGGFTGSV